MLNNTPSYNNNIFANPRTVQAKIGVYKGAYLAQTLTKDDYIKEITIDRSGEEGKFFGVVVCHKLTVKLLDKNRDLDIDKTDILKVSLGVQDEYKAFPDFYISEITRDQKTNDLTIVAYDLLNGLNDKTFGDLQLETPYSVYNIASKIAEESGFAGVKYGKNRLTKQGLSTPLTDRTFWHNTTISQNYVHPLEDGWCKWEVDNSNGNQPITSYLQLLIGSVEDLAPGKKYTFELQFRNVSYTGTPTVRFGNGTSSPGCAITDYYPSSLYDISKDKLIVHEFNIGSGNAYSMINVINVLPRAKFSFEMKMLITPLQDTMYVNQANYNGDESFKEIIKQISEFTQTFAFVNSENEIEFKRLSNVNALVIDKDKYFSFSSNDTKNIKAIVETNELEDELIVSIEDDGETQYIRDNGLLSLLSNKEAILNAGLNEIKDKYIMPFKLQYRGDPSLEIGDRIAIDDKNNNLLYSYVLNSTIKYNGALTEDLSWEFKESKETPEKPATLGTFVSTTSAKVDKVNQKITLVVQDVSDNGDAIANITETANNIELTVENMQLENKENLDDINDKLQEVINKASLSVSAEDVKIEVQRQLSNGVDKISATGYKFDADGLEINKQGSDMITKISDTGMVVHSQSNDSDMLVANIGGVEAKNLHAKNYLIVNNTIRFETFQKDGKTRIGCFWIGG